MECPRCGLENPKSAMSCDCGYIFKTGEIRDSTEKQSDNTISSSYETVGRVDVVSIIIGLVFIVGGLSGSLVLRGTGSSMALILLGVFFFGKGIWEGLRNSPTNAKGSGTTRIYNASFETIWEEIPKIIDELGLSVVTNNYKEGGGYLLAKRIGGTFSLSYGEEVAIFVGKARDTTQTRVEVISKRVDSMHIFAPNWENKIIEKLDRKLKA